MVSGTSPTVHCTTNLWPPVTPLNQQKTGGTMWDTMGKPPVEDHFP